MSNHKAEIRSLEHTIKEHRSYILELKTKQYRGKVTDDRIQTMNNQISECQQTIEELKKGAYDANVFLYGNRFYNQILSREEI